MGAPVVDASKGTSADVLTEIPWLIRRLRITSGNTATAIAHGGPAAPPDMYWGVQIAGTTPDGGLVLSAPTTTTITMDFSDDGNDTWYVYLVWFSQAAGGVS